MEEATEQALAVIAGLDSPMLQTDFLIDTAQLCLAHGLPIYELGPRRTPANCLAHGYWGQASQILALPKVDRLLPAEVIARLASAATRAGA